MAKWDFGGYATKNDLKCADGRVIRHNAFVDNDGNTVPLVWQHQRNDPKNVLGHALLENRNDGVYAYCKFNETEAAKTAKELVTHGDICALSIYANQLIQKGSNVTHGAIREVSLVLAGANPGALIDNLCIEHGDGNYDTVEDEAVIYTGIGLTLSPVEIEHSDDEKKEDKSSEKNDGGKADDKTVKDVFDSLTEEQKTVVYAMIGTALASKEDDDDSDDAEHSDEGGKSMKHSIFDQENNQENTLTHDEETAILADGKRYGSLKESVLQHGITDIDILFPEAQLVRNQPDMITRNMDWVDKVWNAAKKSPFSRIKSMAANLTADEARAKGYIKGKKKTEEQFGLLKRVTTPQTVYKKQSLDRDDIIDITSFDVVAWLKAEMRMMLKEELARAALVGDGRSSSSDDKINPINIRPIWTDADMYTIKYTVTKPTSGDKTDEANAIIDAAHMARIDYKGSGSPTFYTDSKTLTTMLLARDKIGHRLYNTVSELASALRVKEIVEVPVMENLQRTDSDGNKFDLIGLIVNMSDYTIGADRGGAVSFFDDFDIDYNKEKYLIETRCSGALTLPYSAIALEYAVSTTPSPGPSTGTEAAG